MFLAVLAVWLRSERVDWVVAGETVDASTLVGHRYELVAARGVLRLTDERIAFATSDGAMAWLEDESRGKGTGHWRFQQFSMYNDGKGSFDYMPPTSFMQRLGFRRDVYDLDTKRVYLRSIPGGYFVRVRSDRETTFHAPAWSPLLPLLLFGFPAGRCIWRFALARRCFRCRSRLNSRAARFCPTCAALVPRPRAERFRHVIRTACIAGLKSAFVVIVATWVWSYYGETEDFALGRQVGPRDAITYDAHFKSGELWLARTHHHILDDGPHGDLGAVAFAHPEFHHYDSYGLPDRFDWNIAGFAIARWSGEAWGIWRVKSDRTDAFIPFWFLGVIAGAVPTWQACKAWKLRRRCRNRLGRTCAACGYNLTGNTSGVCPECGVAIQKS